MPWKMKVDDNPFLGDQNMVDVGIFKGKTKVLTSARSREARTVDPEIQMSADEYREVKNVVISRRADTSRGKRQRMERRGRESHLVSC